MKLVPKVKGPTGYRSAVHLVSHRRRSFPAAERSRCATLAQGSLAACDIMTCGDVLQYRIAFALSRAFKTVRGARQGVTKAERFAVADHVAIRGTC
jgi:hypothetical protein